MIVVVDDLLSFGPATPQGQHVGEQGSGGSRQDWGNVDKWSQVCMAK